MVFYQYSDCGTLGAPSLRGGGIWGSLGASLGLIFEQSRLREPGKGPEGPPKGPGEGPGAEKKYSKRVLGGSWSILRLDFSENAPPGGPQKGSKRGAKTVSKQKRRKVKKKRLFS